MFVACAYPIVDNYVSARTKAVFKGPQRATYDMASQDVTAFDEMNLQQLPGSNADSNEAMIGTAWFVEIVDGSEGQEDPVSRSVDGRAVQLTS